MISEYFFPPKMKDEKAQEVVKQRLDEIKNFVHSWCMKFGNGNWGTVSTYSYKPTDGTYFTVNDRFYMNTNHYEQMKNDWINSTRVKIEDTDWKYILYMVVKDMGYQVSYANGTLAVCMDIPPIQKSNNFERKVKPKWLKEA